MKKKKKKKHFIEGVTGNLSLVCWEREREREWGVGGGETATYVVQKGSWIISASSELKTLSTVKISIICV